MENENLLSRLLKERHDPRYPFLWKRLHLDPRLLISLFFIVLIGLLSLFSASRENLTILFKQILWIGIGFILLFFTAQLHPNTWKRLASLLFILSLGALLMVLLIGHTGKGAQRWINLGLIRFQPSEMVKLTLPLFLAYYFNQHSIPPRKIHIFKGLMFTFIPLGLVLKQPDMGTAILIAVSGLSVILFSGIRWRFLIGTGLTALACIPMVWYFMHDYQRMRILTFLNPERDPLGAGYHILQSKIAIGSGGLLGKGWLQGTQGRLDFLPEHSTDFIFSAFAEEWGWLGCFILLGLYSYICYRIFKIAYETHDNFSRLFASSLGSIFFSAIFVNIGMVSGLLPVVGVPLPFFSYGGTALLTLMISFGILMSIGTRTKLVEQ